MVKEELALPKIQEFINLLEEVQAIEDTTNGFTGPSPSERPDWKARVRDVHLRLPVIEGIAEAVDKKLRERITHGVNYGSGFTNAIAASYELAGHLQTAHELAEIREPRGPQYSASQLHRWVWEEAASRWDHGFFRDAVQSAATRIFDVELPAKLGVQPVDKPADLFAAFSTDPASRAGTKRLRFRDTPKDDPSWEGLHRGAMLYGQGCVKAIRNPRTHRLGVPDDQVAFEELAGLSLLARWIENAELVVEGPVNYPRRAADSAAPAA